MIPIHELLSRIRWDKEFGQGHFEIGYYDRLLDRIIRVPLARVSFGRDQHAALEVRDVVGEKHQVPLHRIYQIFKDDRLIWQRPWPKEARAGK